MFAKCSQFAHKQFDIRCLTADMRRLTAGMGRSRLIVGRLVVACLVIAGITATGVGAASAASVPTAVTGPASAVNLTSVTVSGNVDPNGTATSWYFEYGTSATYGAKTTEHDAGSGAAAVAVSSGLSGLTPGTTYHFRLVATSSAGTAAGADGTFATLASAPTVTAKPASNIGHTSVRLNGSVDPNGLATVWYVQYGTTTSYGSTTATQSAGSGRSAVGVSVTAAKLAPNTTYHFRLVATNAVGTASGQDETFVTTGPPRAVTGPATNVAATSATLNGEVYPGGEATQWYFEYGPGGSLASRTAAQPAGSGGAAVPVTDAITGLAPATTYRFRLVAISNAGTSLGNDGAFTTPSPTLSASSRTVVYGRGARLSGTVPGGPANSPVAVFARKLTDGSFVWLSTVLTAPGGAWTLVVTPRMRTTYKVLWESVPSTAVTIGVEPSVSLRSLPGGWFTSHVADGRPLRGHLVRLQRLVGRVWRTISAARLGARATARLHPRLPAGVSRLRVLVTAYQAGPGYLAGTSAVHRYRRR